MVGGVPSCEGSSLLSKVANSVRRDARCVQSRHAYTKTACNQMRYIFSFRFRFISNLRSTPSCRVEKLGTVAASGLVASAETGRKRLASSSFVKKYTRVLSPLAYRFGLHYRQSWVEEHVDNTYCMYRDPLNRSCVRSLRP